MKKVKKLIALVIALAMVLGMMGMTVLADDPTDGDSNEGLQLATAEDTIYATKVVAGDSVEYYQLVEWKDGNWALTALGEECGVTLANLEDGINEEEATTIASNLSGKTKTGEMNEDSTTPTTFVKTNVAAGLYYLKAIPAETNLDTVYNPAFVSADYKSGGNTVDFSTSFANSAVVKKSNVPFDKTVDSETATEYVDVKPDDVIPYKITTQIPSYGTSFTDPVFKITDTFSNGLTLEGDISVKIGEDDAITETTEGVVVITKGTPENGFTVAFEKAYLKGLNGDAPNVVITYAAKVGAVTDNVTYMDNKAKLTFSNKPGETVDKDDITRHYTFSIDGNLLGSTDEQTHELIKTSCDPDGNPIFEEKVTYYDKKVNPLDDASFTLTPVDPTTDDPIINEARTVSSANGGHIQFLGLDAGKYELVENSAPSGYVKDSKTYIVEIIPAYNESSDAPILESYSVKFYVKGSEQVLTTSTFTTTNEGGTVVSSAHAESAQLIGNTPGTELPSTGGIGTTIFYVVGAILVIGAGVVLVTKRRMNR